MLAVDGNDGTRNNDGPAFDPDGRLFATEQGPDDRGSRPVRGPDHLREVAPGGWIGDRAAQAVHCSN